MNSLAYQPYADPDEFIREVTDLIWVERNIGFIRENYEPDSIVHGGLGTILDREQVLQGTLMRIADTPNRVGQAEDVIWEARDDDAFLSSHLILSTDLQNPEFRSRGIANCLYRRGRMVEEWVVRDTLAVARQRGQDPSELGRAAAFAGWQGSMLDPAPVDICRTGASGRRPDLHRSEVEMVLEFIESVWNGRDLRRVDEFFVRDLVLNTVDDRTITRPEGYRRALLRFLRPFPGGVFDVLDVATNDAARYGGLRIAVAWRFRGKYEGHPTFGMPTGQPINVLGISQFLLQAARLVRETRMYDGVAIWAQIAATRGDEPAASVNIY